jgi:cytidylate kinase
LPPAVPSRVICISHTTGAGGESVARAAAERLGYRFVDEEIVVEAAEREDIDPEVVADVERRRTFLESWTEALDTGTDISTAATAAGGVVWVPASWQPETRRDYPPFLRDLIRQVILDTADKGDVVIASHAASYALAGRNGVLRVLVTASPETRAARIREARDLGEKDAAKALKDADAGREDYLRRFYDVEREQPTDYDLVVNTDVLGPTQAAAVVADAARA